MADNTVKTQQPTNDTGGQENQIVQVQPWKQNANMNFNQYGDDSNPEYQQKALGGMYNKFTGEWVDTAQVNYDSNITSSDLGNMSFGQAGREANTNQANYLAQRNDKIASALYNEWKTSKEDITYYLASQQWWNNSTENDRMNTVEAIRKRMWDIAKQQEGQQPTQEEQKNSPEFTDRSEAEKWGKISGRASGDKNNMIDTLVDPYSIDVINQRTRQLNLQSLQSMSSYDIALSLDAGYSIYGDTAMRDLATMDPVKYQEIQTELKKIQAWNTANDIASWTHGSATEQVENATNVVNDSIEAWVNQNSNERTYDQVEEQLTSKLEFNQTANSATQEMINIKKQIADLEEEKAGLFDKVKKEFKWDVPQYIIEARVSNEGQRIQSELNKLESRYNSMLDLYKIEVSNAQWQTEMELKQKEYNFKVNQQNWENAFKTRQQDRIEQYQANSLLMNNIKTDKDGKPYIINPDGTYEYLTDATYEKAIKSQIQKAVDALNLSWQDGMDGGQCEEFTDTFNNTTFWKSMVPIDENGNPISGRNRTYGSEKAQYVTDAIPEVGMTAIFKYPYTANVSNASKIYWHTMMVTGYDPSTGMITLKWSNGPKGDQKVYTTTMSLEDFYGKKYGAGFWAPWHQTWFEEDQQWDVVGNTWPEATKKMTQLYDDLIENAGTQGTRDVLATAQSMYETIASLRDDGSLEELINAEVFQDALLDWKKKSWSGEDWWSEFSQVLKKLTTDKNLTAKQKNALNKLFLMVESKLRNESGAAISSSEWSNNFSVMIPELFESDEDKRNVLKNWDIVIKKYSRSGGMKSNEYIPLFADEEVEEKERESWAG